MTDVKIGNADFEEPYWTCQERVIDDLRREYIRRALCRTAGRTTHAAKLMRVEVRILNIWIRHLGIDVWQYRTRTRPEKGNVPN